MEEPRSLEYTPTWIISLVCSIIVLISLLGERGLHQLGKCLKKTEQYALNEALDKLKGELMLLGFISLLLTVSQGPISNMCISRRHASIMLPCKLSSHRVFEHFHSPQTINNGRRLLSEANEIKYCARKGKVPLFPREALHQLHIFIFVLAVVHVIFCVTTMCFGEMKMRLWKQWEDSIENNDISTSANAPDGHIRLFYLRRAIGYWREYRPIGWMMSFFKQFYGSVTKSDYIALRSGFIQEHCPKQPGLHFHKYLLRSLEHDFEQIDDISWYLWLFVVLFLLLNLAGWHPYFWLSFLPLILLLLVGAHLEHVITRLARVVAQREPGKAAAVKLSDDHFLLGRPKIILYIIHFTLFQNSFEIAFFIWIWISYGFQSCMMEPTGLTIPRLIVGFIVQVLCSYSTLPLYALVTQMGCKYKEVIFDEAIGPLRGSWNKKSFVANASQRNKVEEEAYKMISVHVDAEEKTVCQAAGTTALANELKFSCKNHEILPSP